jgi:8-oxo-dGTP diphosphatase
VYHNDPSVPPATVVTRSVFVAVRGVSGRLLLVRRCDSGVWELPGGRVDVGIFTDPGHVIRSLTGEIRQRFAVVFHARAVGGHPHPDMRETSEAVWVAVADLPHLPIEPPCRLWIAAALAPAEQPQLA